MRGTQAAARAQLIRARNVDDLSDANYRHNTTFCVRPHCQSVTAIRGHVGDVSRDITGCPAVSVRDTGSASCMRSEAPWHSNV